MRANLGRKNNENYYSVRAPNKTYITLHPIFCGLSGLSGLKG